jgi:hypothetical protein
MSSVTESRPRHQTTLEAGWARPKCVTCLLATLNV